MCFLYSDIATRRIREGFVLSVCAFQCVLAACLLAVIKYLPPLKKKLKKEKLYFGLQRDQLKNL